MDQRQFKVAFTFDDLLLIPGHSAVLPGEVDVRSRLSRNIQLSVPIVSAAMDTVTESETAISIAREGGIGIIHRNMSVERQALEVNKVKKLVRKLPVETQVADWIEQAKKLLRIG